MNPRAVAPPESEPAEPPARTDYGFPPGRRGLPAVPPPRQAPPGYGRRAAAPGGGSFPVQAMGRGPMPSAPPRPGLPGSTRPMLPPGRGFGLPSLRRNVCPHFYMTGTRGAIPIQAPHLLKGLLRQPNNISRCQLRGGVHLDEGYVNDVCLTPRFNQCVFYEDDLTRE